MKFVIVVVLIFNIYIDDSSNVALFYFTVNAYTHIYFLISSTSRWNYCPQIKMKFVPIFSSDLRAWAVINSTCGRDNSPVSMVYEGVAPVKSFPWMGMLYYPMGRQRFTTAVVLVTRQLVVAAASEIDKLPKVDFRIKTRVVLGSKCGENEIKIRDYSYHPEFNKNSFSALAMIQLEIDHVKIELRPICQPPAHFIKPQFFVLTMTEGCKDPKVRIHRMQYVNMNDCKDFYRRSGLGQDSLWPVHAACARAVSGGRCVWRSGSVLAVKQDGRWRLLGFSVYGPGCGAPARFLDYGVYHRWIRRSTTTIGLPAITRLDDNQIIMRRSMSSVQRFGPCDAEETKGQLYMDRITIFYQQGTYSSQYNVSLYANVEYSCLIFTARPLYYKAEYAVYDTTAPSYGVWPNVLPLKPKIRLRRWCASPIAMCHGFQHLEIQFFIEILFRRNVEFAVRAYGKEAKIIAPNRALRLTNRKLGVYPVIPMYLDVLQELIKWKRTSKNKWFFY